LVLGLGHLGLGLSTSYNGVLISAFLFGIGEGMSTGLRDVNKKDYRNKNGPLGDLSRKFITNKLKMIGMNYTDSTEVEYKAKLLRNKIQGLAGPWADWCGILNSIAVGIIGRYYGMRQASFVYASVAAFAVYVSVSVIPDSKAPFVVGVSDQPLWKSWRCCYRKTPVAASYVALQPIRLNSE